MDPGTRQMTVVAQDPSVRLKGRILTARVRVPWEDLVDGPIGHRVQLVDYDATTQTLYRPGRLAEDVDDDGNLVEPADDAAILGSPSFHACNAYALVMRTIARFEKALGRRVTWGFGAHQLKVVPHAFEEANAFYSRDAQALLFGYYRTRSGLVFTGLSHDVVVHETTHALLDGLRNGFMAPSSPDQAAFHEAFADIVALLSVFSLDDVLRFLVARDRQTRNDLVAKENLEFERLADSWLLGLADEMKPDIDLARVDALRRSVKLAPARDLLDRDEFRDAPHRRGEVLVAAVMRTFVYAWLARLRDLRTIRGRFLDANRVAEEGAAIAEDLLTMVIRALDYTPPVHISFPDYLCALVTADTEFRPVDRFGLRAGLLEQFAAYGIEPASGRADGLWNSPEGELVHDGVRFGSLQTDPVEMFRLIWRNRALLAIDPTAYTRVDSVRPCIRTSDDGLPLRETVAEVQQYVSVAASELGDFDLEKPDGMPDGTQIALRGGSTLLLDEYGRLKYEIYQRLPGASADTHAQERLEYLWTQGYYDPGRSISSRLSTIHRQRAGESPPRREETW